MKQNPKKARRRRLFNLAPGSLSCLAMIFLCLLALSCRRARSGPDLLPRPQPGYTAWLEQQSMLAQADSIIAQVSQTGRVWMFSAQGAPVDTLLAAAPQWLEVSASTFSRPAFLASLPARFPALLDAGLKGIYLGPLGEDQSHWQADGKKALSDRLLPASLNLDSRLGDERDLENLMAAAEKAGLELGADIPGAATSMGPDFFLQARNAAGHAGLYAMLELPQKFWPLLPASSGEWDSASLDEAQRSSLVASGILPQTLRRDQFAWTPDSGWAATGEVMGTDGKMRRWLYRYEGDPASPVLLWQDPSGLARKIFSAAIIRQTGFWRIPLAGLRLSALMGLEPQDGIKASEEGAPNLSPGLEALNALASQIHRYGGWALQADPLPLELVDRVLAGECDFCREDLTASLVLKALRDGDAEELAALYSHWLESGLEQKRLARGFNAGVQPASAKQALPRQGKLPPSRSSFPSAALLGWRLGLPGLAFFSPGEIVGETLDVLAPQKSPGSDLKLADSMKNVLKLRAGCGLAEGRLVAVPKASPAALGALSRLPEKGFWLLATNFGVDKAQLSVDLPDRCRTCADAASGENLDQYLMNNGRKFVISLDGYEVRHVIFYMD